MILTLTQMGIDTHIPRHPPHDRVVPIGHMLSGFQVTILHGHTEIDFMDDLV